MSGIAPKQNAFKFKIAPHKQNSIVKTILAGRWAPLANGTHLSTMVNPALLARVLKDKYTIHTNDDGCIVNYCQQYFAFTFAKFI